MELTQSISMRQDMRQLLTPRMIQSMEILQLPLLALEERIEQELQQNPVLELREGDTDPGPAIEDTADEPGEDRSESEQPLVISQTSADAEEFGRLERIADYLENEEFHTNMSMNPSASSYAGERDKKLDAMNNTVAHPITLTEHLLGQWTFVQAPKAVHDAGVTLIEHLDDDGYLRTDLQTVREQTKSPPDIEDFNHALILIQTLEPPGVGARNLRECLLLQLDALEQDDELAQGHDFDLERQLINNHLRDLEMNRYPRISKKLGVGIDRIKLAVRQLARLDPHPGRQIGGRDAPSITPDATIYFDPETDKYEIQMANQSTPDLHISRMWRQYLKQKKGDRQTREFLTNNVRNAKWLIESLAQRQSTILRVIRVVVDAQREFFDKGPEFLKPLPMIQVADQLGIHVATVSRAVSEKWIQTPRGIFPLRRFFSGGTTNAEGDDMSWDAVKEKLRLIIAEEDKNEPLNDEQIVARLTEQGIDIARRTVAKYRRILHIPTARQRREY